MDTPTPKQLIAFVQEELELCHAAGDSYSAEMFEFIAEILEDRYGNGG